MEKSSRGIEITHQSHRLANDQLIEASTLSRWGIWSVGGSKTDEFKIYLCKKACVLARPGGETEVNTSSHRKHNGNIEIDKENGRMLSIYDGT